MTKTTNYQLNQWDAADPVRREDFNADNAIIDAALAGQLRIATGSYVGTGTYGSSTPNTLTAPFMPVLVIIVLDRASTLISGTALLYGQQKSSGIGGSSATAGTLNLNLQWEENTLTWYSTTSAEKQLNASDLTYHYLILG